MTTAVVPGAGNAETDLLRRRLRRVAGQVLGIERMLAEQRPCADLLIQLAAAQGALRAASAELFARHIRALDEAVAAGAAHPADAAAETTQLADFLT